MYYMDLLHLVRILVNQVKYVMLEWVYQIYYLQQKYKYYYYIIQDLLNEGKAWCDIFNSLNLNANIYYDPLQKRLWKKLIVNCAINPLTALNNIKNGELLRSDKYKKVMCSVIKECMSVMTDEGMELKDKDEREYEEQPYIVAEQTADNYSSMLSDVRHNRRTENEALLGYVIRKADLYIEFIYFA